MRLDAEIEKRQALLAKMFPGPFAAFDARTAELTFLGASFGTPTAELEPPLLLDTTVYNNDTDAEGNESWTVDKTYTSQVSAMVTRGLGVQIGGSFEVSVPLEYLKLGFKVDAKV